MDGAMAMARMAIVNSPAGGSYSLHVHTWYVWCCNALHFKHCGVIYRLEPMPKYRHTIVVNVAFTPIIVILLLILELLAQLVKGVNLSLISLSTSLRLDDSQPLRWG